MNVLEKMNVYMDLVVGSKRTYAERVRSRAGVWGTQDTRVTSTSWPSGTDCGQGFRKKSGV